MADPGRTAELLTRLGLAPGAAPAQMAEAHQQLVAYLSAAPRAVRPWARQQLVDVEAAYATLARELGRGMAPARVQATTAARYVASDADDAEELLDALDDGAPAPARHHVTVKRGRAPAVRASREPGAVIGAPRWGGVRRLALGVGVLAIAAVGIVAVYELGQPTVPGLTGSPVPGATAAGVDQAQVVALMEKLSTNPRDVTALRALADLYYAAGDNASSRSWLLKVLEIEPKNIEALLGAGATAYNLDDFAAAEKSWQAVVAIDPKNVDAHYDLGLMYFSKDPPDLDRMRQEWNEVIALSPDSELASIVRTHMPDASGGPSAAPTGAPASPLASPG